MFRKYALIAALFALTVGGFSQTPTYVKRSGDSMTGPLVLSADPSASLGAATKQYVDAHSGVKGDTGATGSTGLTGATGTAATVTVGTVTTGAAGSSATVTNGGTSSAAVFNFTIPQGVAGTGGSGGGATIATTTQLLKGDNAGNGVGAIPGTDFPTVASVTAAQATANAAATPASVTSAVAAEATLARSASNLSSGTVPLARIPTGTASSTVALGDAPAAAQAAAIASAVSTSVQKSGGTMTGLLVLSGDPSANLGAATKQYVDTHAGGGTSSGPSLTLAPVAYNAYGDSITTCVFSPGITCYVNRIAAALSIPAPGNYGMSGAQVCDVALSALPVDVPSLTAQQPLRTLMIGTNDAANKGSGAYEPTFTSCYSGILSYLAIPVQSKKMGGDVFTVATYTGTCTNDTTYAPADGIDCTSTGATATFTLTTVGGPIYIWPRIIDSDSGAWTYSLDGRSAVSQTTSITPAIATNNQGGTSKSIGFIRIPSVSAGSHTLVFTKTNASGNMAILGVGTPQSLTLNPSGPVVIAGDVPNEIQPGGASLSILAAYNADIYAAVNTLSGDGLAIYQAYPSKYLQATDAAGDMVNVLHPNAVGNGELAAAFMGSAVRLVPGQQIPTSNSNLPTYYSSSSLFTSGGNTATTASMTCPVGHTMVFSMSAKATNDTIALTTTTTNTIVPIVSNHATATRVIAAWYVNCDGSTGTFTGTLSGPSGYGYLARYETVGGHFDSYGICSGNTSPCSVTETVYGLVIAEMLSIDSDVANANVAGWVNRLNDTDNSIWDTNAMSGVVSFPVNYDASVGSDRLIINLKP